MDFIEGLPKSKGRDTILVVVDRLSKYAHFLSLSHPFSAPQVAQLFLTEIIKLHGIPRSIVSDRDKIFLSTFWSELFRLLGSDLRRSSAYHPRTDGQTEVVNRCVETYLRCFLADKRSRWLDWLAWAEYNYNTSFHTTTNTTPFKVVYGWDPPPVIRYEWGSTTNQEVESVLLQRDAILAELKCHLHRAQQKMKERANSKHREVHWSVGDFVYVKLHPYRQSSLARRVNEKLSPRFYGPFKILQKIGPVAYKLELPDTACIHPIFHVSLLKKAVGSQAVSPSIPTSLSANKELIVQPATVLGIRPSIGPGAAGTKVLIHWHDLPVCEDSWELFEVIQSQFPNFNLEDKVNAWVAGNDKPRIQVTYARRRKGKSPAIGDILNC